MTLIANYTIKLGFFLICCIIAMICLNGVSLSITINHKFDDRIKIQLDGEIDHKTPYPLRIVNGY